MASGLRFMSSIHSELLFVNAVRQWSSFILFFFFKFYLFIYGCVGSSLLHEGFL